MENAKKHDKKVTLVRSCIFQGFLVMIPKPQHEDIKDIEDRPYRTVWIDPLLEDTPLISYFPHIPHCFFNVLRDPGSAYYFSSEDNDDNDKGKKTKKGSEKTPLIDKKNKDKGEDAEDRPLLPAPIDALLTSGYDHLHRDSLALLRKTGLVPPGVLVTSDEINLKVLKEMGYTNIVAVTRGQPAQYFYSPRHVVIDVDSGETWWGEEMPPPRKKGQPPRLFVKGVAGPIDLVVHVVEDEATGVVILYAPHNLTPFGFDWIRKHTTHIDVIIILAAQFQFNFILMRWMKISASLDEGYNYIKTLAKEKDVKYVIEVHQEGTDMDFEGWFEAMSKVARVGSWDDFVARAEKDPDFPKEVKLINPPMGETVELNLN